MGPVIVFAFGLCLLLMGIHHNVTFVPTVSLALNLAILIISKVLPVIVGAVFLGIGLQAIIESAIRDVLKKE